MKKIVLLGVLFLSACSSLWGYGVEPGFIRDGVQVYRASCNGNLRDIGDCYTLASEQCGGDFEVVNSLENNKGSMFNNAGQKTTFYNGDSRNEFKTNSGVKTNFITRSLFFYCKK